MLSRPAILPAAGEVRFVLEYTEYTKLLIALLAIVNPLGAVPIFVALTSDASAADRARIGRMTVIAVVIILLVSVFFGEAILHFFGITIDSFRVGGGILVLLMAISMLQARISGAISTDEEMRESQDSESVAVVPLAIPLLAGPGAISTVILYTHKGTGLVHHLIISADVLTLAAVLWLMFQLVPWIDRHITKTGINIATRIMGLILSAIAVEFIANGIKGLFPGVA